MKERERLPELLVPAGGREQLESAILYGADAVYMGGPELSLRTACEGFSGEELGLAVADAHTAGVRVYYCLNARRGSRVGAFARDGRGRPHCR